MRHKTIIAAILVAATARAAADPAREDQGVGSADHTDREVIVHLKSDADCVSTKGTHFQLPPGYELDEATWAARDAEYKRRGDAETRLAAENASLKASAGGPGHWTILVTVVTAAFAAGYLLGK